MPRGLEGGANTASLPHRQGAEKARGSRRSYKRDPRSGACRSGASRELLVLPHDPPANQASPAGSLHVGDRLVARAADLEEGVAARHVAGGIELVVAACALVVDVLAFGDQLLGLGPLAGHDRLA